MDGTGGFPVDIVLFGMVAAFLVLRLRSILGRRQGFERPADPHAPQDARVAPPAAAREGPVIDGTAEPVSARAVPDPTSPTGQTLAAMAGIDRQFQPARFLDGAEAAFRLIVTAYAAGDRARLRGLLSDDTFHAFDAAITAREAAGETQRTEIRAIPAASIEHAELHGSVAALTVRFISDQVNLTVGHDGQPVTGTDAVTELNDLWTFERDLAAADPTWRLVAARSA